MTNANDAARPNVDGYTGSNNRGANHNVRFAPHDGHAEPEPRADR